MNDNEKDIKYIQSLKVDKIFLWDKNPRFVIDFSSDFNINYDNDDKLELCCKKVGFSLFSNIEIFFQYVLLFNK